MNFNESSFQETSEIFNSESDKLYVIIENALQKSEQLTIPEIVQVYYQIISVNALLKVVKQNFAQTEEQGNITQEHKMLLHRVDEVQNLISDEFNAKLHPLVISQLTNSINYSMNTLKSVKKGAHGEKSKDIIERKAKLYEKLRQTMSTKEFVEQYNKGLE